MTDRMSRWEYKVAAIELGGHDAGMGELTKLGNAGWELVQTIGDSTRGGRLPFIFKRPRPERAQTSQAASIIRAMFRGPRHPVTLANPQGEAENRRLRDEVSQLKDRIKVLERIAVEKENSLANEIESLRDR